ncbi:MAG TPA: NAD-dependent epimerase/dehydratase family protein [Chthoniobacterales bacterium]
MRRILVAGCGYLGTAVAKRFVEAGWDVAGWKLRKLEEEVSQNGIRVEAVDLSDSESVCRNSFDAEVVVHCAGAANRNAGSYRRVYQTGLANLAASFPQARLIFTSSTSVYAQSDREWVNEESPAEPSTETGRILRSAEEIVLSRGGIVLRVAGIYGPGRSFLLRSVVEGTAKAPDSDRITNQVHRDDISTAIFFLAGEKAIMPPRIFNVVDDLPVPRSEILKWLSQQLTIPLADSNRATPRRKRGDSNKRVSNAKLRALGWAPIYPSYIEGFRRSIFPSSNLHFADVRGES